MVVGSSPTSTDLLAERAIPSAPGAPELPAAAASTIARAGELYDRGLYLQAFRAGAALGALPAWPGPRGQVLAGRLANQLGRRAQGDRLHVRARRRFPADGEAWVAGTRAVATRLGALAGFALLRRGPPAAAPRHDVLVLEAQLAVWLRDFETADRALAEALPLAPDDPWVVLQQGFVATADDDRAGALAAVARARALSPWYRPAVELEASTLVALGREEEALALLGEAMARLECASVGEQLLQLQLERGEHEAAGVTLARLAELTPLRDAGYERWLEARRSDAAHGRGDRAGAIAHARSSRYPFYEALAGRLEAAAAEARRVLLPVPWVRQHHMTCAPATLAALCGFHGVEAAHLGIAEAICYDGTPDHAERRWAAERGFAVREFTVTFEAAVALLARGLPFTLVMTEPASSHLVAVVGHDDARGVLLLRDPSFRSLTEITPGWLDEHRSSGPRGMALAPPGQVDRLAGLELPDAALYDLYHDVQRALVAHDRARAAARAAELHARAPGHRLALWAERSLASYDGDEERLLAAIEALLRAYPDDVNLRLSRQGSLANLGRRQERIDWLRAEHTRRGHPLLAQALAGALADDARDLGEALALARAGVRRRPSDGVAHHLLADLLWGAGARDEAELAYRAASCLDQANEHFAESYFRAARWLGHAELALRFLRARFERNGGRSHWPAVTLGDALDALDRGPELLAMIERAVERRPDDGQLLLHAARCLAQVRHLDRAGELLGRARGKAHEAEVTRTVALLEELRGDLPAAAAARLRGVELEPLDVGGVREAARLLADTRDRAAAVAFLRAHVARFPHHQGLSRALVAWLDDAPPAEREAELRRVVAAAPSDAWALRELALHLSRHGREDEAFEALARAAAIEPRAPALHNVRAALLGRAGRAEEARAALRESLRLEVDQDWAIEQLLELAPDAAGRVAELAFLRAELARQVGFGDGLLAYQHLGAGVLPPEELLTTLREAHAARPDLWHAWVALARQLLHAGRSDEAEAHLAAATRRFPLLPRVWLELGHLARARGDTAGWRRALEHALELNPTWREAAFQLAEQLRATGEYEPMRAVVARALRHAPSDGFLHGWLAEALLALDREEEALAELERALRLEPSYGWARATLVERCGASGREQVPRRLAAAIVQERPLDARAWLLAAQLAEEPGAALEATGRALALQPREVEAVALRAELLAEAGRVEEAIAAIAAPPWPGLPPRALRLLAARLEAQRGREREARVALEELLRSEPDFTDGWELAAEWHDAAGRHEDCVAAVRQLVRLSPHRAASHGWLGLALVASGDRADGKQALARALQLDPGYVWALRRLFDLRLEDGELPEAEALLAALERHVEEPEIRRRRLDLALRRGAPREAAEELVRLAASAERSEVEAATAALLGAGAAREVEAVLSPLLADQAAPRAAGGAWAMWAERELSPRAIDRRLAAAVGAGPPAPALAGALERWLERLGERHERGRLRRWRRRGRAVLEADDRLWGSLGYALTAAGDRRGVLGWLGGWRERPGAAAWMLLNLSVSLVALGRLAEAAEVSRAALARASDRSHPHHRIVLAAEAALRGDLGLAAGLRALEGLGPLLSGLASLARALAAGLAPGDRRAAWSAAGPHLAAASAVAGREAGLARCVARALWALARHRGGGGPATAWWLAVGLARSARAWRGGRG